MSMYIGITGGIGSGKTAVSAYLRSLGETVICADETARLVVAPGEEGSAAVRELFGPSFFNSDGTLNRSKLAAEVFEDDHKRKLLEDALHPIIIRSMFAQAEDTAGRVFFDAALLIQSRMHLRMDYTWLVVADTAVRIARIISRDHMAEALIRSRMDAQLSDERMLPYADDVIDNNGDLTALHQQIDSLLEKPIYREDTI